jgi:hypothetical protein
MNTMGTGTMARVGVGGTGPPPRLGAVPGRRRGDLPLRPGRRQLRVRRQLEPASRVGVGCRYAPLGGLALIRGAARCPVPLPRPGSASTQAADGCCLPRRAGVPREAAAEHGQDVPCGSIPRAERGRG